MTNRLSPSARLSLIYLAVSVAWIIGSDNVVHYLVTNPETGTLLQSIKGILFVCACTALIYFVSHKYYTDIQKSLAEKEGLLSKYKALNEASKEGVVEYDLETNTAIINEQLKQFLGLPGTVISNFSAAHDRVIHSQDKERVAQSFRETRLSNADLWQTEYRCLWNDGTYHEVINKGYFIRDKITGQAKCFVCAIQDVMELRTIQAQYYEERLERKRELGKSIIAAQEEERNRWAAELHDNVCQMLTVVKLHLAELAHGRPLPSSVAHQPEILVDKALTEIRQLSASVRPPEFDDITLEEALVQLIASIQRVKIYTFSLQMAGLNEDLLNEQHKLMIYRVVQEGISNIIKYAEPTTVIINVSSCGSEVKLRITDDGKGFDQAKRSGGIGLRNIKSRLQVFNGSMRLETAPDKGCTLSAQFYL